VGGKFRRTIPAMSIAESVSTKIAGGEANACVPA